MKYALLPFTSLSLLLLPIAAQAQGGPPPGLGADTITVGLGVGVTSAYDGAKDYRFIPGGTIFGTISNHDFRFTGLQLFVDAVPNDYQRKIDYEVGPVIGLGLNRTGNARNDRVDALGNLDAAVEVGLRGAVGVRNVFHPTDKLSFGTTAVWDVAGAHRSHVITPSIEYSTLAGKRTFLRAAVAADYVGGKWANYNFGIDGPGSVASGLAMYKPKGGFSSVGGHLLATYSLSGQRKGWSLFGVANYKRLQGDVADSPIVRDTGSPNQFFGSFGVGYTF